MEEWLCYGLGEPETGVGCPKKEVCKLAIDFVSNIKLHL